MKVHDAVIAFTREHSRPPARVYVSPIIQARLMENVRDAPAMKSPTLIGLSVMGTDWYVDENLSGETFRIDP